MAVMHSTTCKNRKTDKSLLIFQFSTTFFSLFIKVTNRLWNRKARAIAGHAFPACLLKDSKVTRFEKKKTRKNLKIAWFWGDFKNFRHEDLSTRYLTTKKLSQFSNHKLLREKILCFKYGCQCPKYRKNPWNISADAWEIIKKSEF